MPFNIKKIVFTLLLALIFLKVKGQNTTDIIFRNAHSMVYNSKESRIYLFGGADEKEVKSELYYLQARKWHKIQVSRSPSARTFASMVYDPDQDRVILFGGNKVLFGKETKSTNLLNDTWQFKNGEWILIQMENAPPPRAEASMVFNPLKKSIILFGGYTIINDDYVKLADTWEFYKGTWSKLSENGPSARNGANMVFDLENNRILLFGGSTIDRQYGESKGETWILQDKKWNKLETEQPTGIYNSAMTYDIKNKRILRFGGWDGEMRTRTNETWVFQNSNWKRIPTSNTPEERNHSAMVYDEKNARIILFGGHDGKNIFDDLWEFKDNSWKKLSGTKPIQRIDNNH